MLRGKMKAEHNGDLIPDEEGATKIVSLNRLYEELQSVRELLQTTISNSRKRIFNNKTLSDYLGVSRRTLQNWRDTGAISFTQVKEVILYSEEDVEAFLRKHKRIAFK
jgi:excisionase family DNA binding protein